MSGRAKGMALFRPQERYRSVADIPVERIADEGVRLVLLDRDNTCVPGDAERPPAEVVRWFERARAAGLALCLVSNNFHSSQVAASAAELGVNKIDHAMKPAPFALWAACEAAGVPAEQTVLVGDQVFTDVASANLAGVRPILVDAQSSKELWYTRVFRLFEKAASGDPAYTENGS